MPYSKAQGMGLFLSALEISSKASISPGATNSYTIILKDRRREVKSLRTELQAESEIASTVTEQLSEKNRIARDLQVLLQSLMRVSPRCWDFDLNHLPSARRPSTICSWTENLNKY